MVSPSRQCSSTTVLKSLAQNGFQECFHNLYSRCQKCIYSCTTGLLERKISLNDCTVLYLSEIMLPETLRSYLVHTACYCVHTEHATATQWIRSVRITRTVVSICLRQWNDTAWFALREQLLSGREPAEHSPLVSPFINHTLYITLCILNHIISYCSDAFRYPLIPSSGSPVQQ